MLYLITGSDRDRARRHWRAVVKALQNKHPALPLFRLTEEMATKEKLSELIFSRSLFGAKFLVALDQVLIENWSALADSPNLFVCLTEELEKKTLDRVKKIATKVESFERAITKPAVIHNPFAIPRAVGERDRQAAWLIFTTALQSGVEVEEIFWKIVWQMKTMLLAKKMGARDVPSLKPFVLSQARRAAENYQMAELETLYGRLIDIHQAARRGAREFPIALERWLLEL